MICYLKIQNTHELLVMFFFMKNYYLCYVPLYHLRIPPLHSYINHYNHQKRQLEHEYSL